jgi:hypothetical protein
MPNSRWSRAVLVLASAFASISCYSGVNELDANADAGDGDTTQDEDPSSKSDGADDDGAADDAMEEACAERTIGFAALRRLTAEQYDHTIRDLLGIDTSYEDTFPPDERIGAFQSNGTAPVGELQVEQYMDAAEEVAAQAVADLSAILPCDPAVVGEDECADAFLREFAPRAYRRPLEDDEIAELFDVYAEAKASADFATGIRVAVQGALQSPWFLYHVELGETAEDEDGLVPLTGWEVASRLSYFLWGTMPDDQLFAAAESGGLTSPEGVAEEVDRMLEDPRAREAIASFHLQWLGVDELESLEKSADAYPGFDAELATSMQADTAAFANWVIDGEDARLQTLLTRAVTLTDDPRLLELYGVEPGADHEPGAPIELDPTQRAGLLTRAGVLARHAHADQTSPVHRGKLVRENFLCTPLPPPPPDVANVPPDPEPGSTTRERFAQHTADPACAGCHALVDGLGFGLEGYDAIGAFRTLDGGLPVDASGEIVGTEDIDGTFDGSVELSARLAESDQVRRCVTTQWFRFGLGRMDTPDDACAVERTYAAFADSDHDVRALIEAIAVSDAFRFRRADA